ncbi:oxysterol-binding protein [Anaeramoeba flamelloides]|uniref:Oxysterol-binding protein n=1 Tax=Anaeramoeba flamelloides TaxID=1746091 RepID=A0ABQ8XDD8_9EUKA|nr:oxysterol-binding protein [Anaeramoeba flamelloides]
MSFIFKSKSKSKSKSKTQKKKPQKKQKLILDVEEPRVVTEPNAKEIEEYEPKEIVIKPSPQRSKNYNNSKELWDRVHYAHQNGGWLYRNHDMIKKQRKIVFEIIKNIAGNIFKSERDLCSITMPVGIFEPRSYLHRLVDIFQFCPIFFKVAAQEKDPLERLKLVICCVILGLHNTVAQAKPFNPILGETFQGNFIDGTEIYCEQVCHHPPISAYEIIDKDKLYHFHGRGQFKSKFKGYSVTGQSEGDNNLEFSDGSKIVFTTPALFLKGIILGDRVVEYSSTATFHDVTNNLYCELTFNPDPRGWIKSMFTSSKSNPTDYFYGQIIKKTHKNIEKCKVLCEVNGSWLGRTDFDDMTYISLKDGWHPVVIYEKKEESLPSDCKHRADLHQLKLGNLKKAATEKHRLEVLQRKDAKLRKKASKK